MKSNRYVAVRILYSVYFVPSSDFDYIFEEMKEEGVEFDKEKVCSLVDLFKEKEQEAEDAINGMLINNDLGFLQVIPAIILKLAYLDLTHLKSTKNICISDYLHISKLLGVGIKHTGLINALLDQVKIES